MAKEIFAPIVSKDCSLGFGNLPSARVQPTS